MNYIILDLEATCWEEKSKFQSEIIEIGAVKINDNQQIVDEFDAFIKPILHPELSEFCTKLTSIKQSQIDMAHGFPIVIEQFKAWIGMDKKYFLCSWGFYDKKQFTADCNLHKLDIEWLKNHMSIKHQHAGLKKLKHPVGLGYAITHEGMKFEGKAHRGIDDARNISRIFLKYFTKWKFM
jgi:inhibitor of KinA sporulation pathway (predicted exonuclease)